MKEIQFQQLDSMKTPEEWVNNALNIPKKNNNSRPFPFRARLIASAAAFIVMVAAGVTVFSLMGRGDGLPTQPPAPQPSATDGAPDVQPHTEIVTTPDGSTAVIVIDGTAPEGSSVYSSLIDGTRPGGAPVTVPGASTAEPSGQATSVSATFPSSAEPTEAPAEQPTALPVEPETDPPEPIDTCNEDPTEPELIPAIDDDFYNGWLFFMIPRDSVFYDSSPLYCHITGVNGEAQTVKFAYAERVNVTGKGDNRSGGYCPGMHQELPFGSYYAEIYDGSGHSARFSFQIKDNRDVTITI